LEKSCLLLLGNRKEPFVESLETTVDTAARPANPFHQEIGMQNLVVWHAERGYLVDFDPFGKQETTWSIDIGKAWVFGSFRDAKAAMRWLSGPLQILPRRTDHK
jgi:hypothetical protein